MKKQIGVLIALLMLASLAGSASAYYDDFNGTSLSSFWSVARSGTRVNASVTGGYLYLVSPLSGGAWVNVTSIPLTLNASGGSKPVLVIEMRLKTNIKGFGGVDNGRSRKFGLTTAGKKPIVWFDVNGNGVIFHTQSIKKNVTSEVPLSAVQNFNTYKFVVLGNGSILVYSNNTKIASVWTSTSQIRVFFRVNTWDQDGQSAMWVDWVRIQERQTIVFNFKNALTGETLSGVTVKENGTTLGTLDSGGKIELMSGTHTLTFSKAGYWSTTKTIDVENNTNVSVEMYPSTAAFRLNDFPAQISTFENTLYTLTFTLSPISTNVTYNTYLQLTNLNPVSVSKDGSKITASKNGYYLGDISSPTQVSITFKAGSVGTHGFSITLKSSDAIASNTYTMTKTVTYKVNSLPFTVQMPPAWKVGVNQLKISEASGQSYTIVAVLRTTNGSQVWSNSYTFGPYEAHTFNVNVPTGGNYTLELMWGNWQAVYNVKVGSLVTLLTKSLTVKKGGSGIITVHIKNPTGSVQYYQLSLSGGFLPKPVTKNIALTPNTAKDVNIAFAVPSKLTYDAYELNVKVTQGNIILLNSKVPVKIEGSSGVSILFGGSGPHIPTWFWPALAGAIVLGIFVFLAGRRR